MRVVIYTPTLTFAHTSTVSTLAASGSFVAVLLVMTLLEDSVLLHVKVGFYFISVYSCCLGLVIVL